MNAAVKLFTVSAIAILSVAARADIIDYSQSFSLNNISNFDSGTYYIADSSTTSSIVSLDRFNSSLGTLTGVGVSFTSNFSHHSWASAYDGSPDYYRYSYRCGWWGTCYSYSYDNHTVVSGTTHARLTVDLFDPNGGYAQLTDSNSISCSDYVSYSGTASCSTSEYQYSTAFDGTLNVGALSLAAFTGTDPLDLRLTNEAWFGYSCDYWDRNGYEYDSCTGSNDVYWAGTATVRYTYDAISRVPEPGTLGLLGLGLVGLGVVRRRKIQ